jgi:ABC-type lipoprotein release transport system permease subunit
MRGRTLVLRGLVHYWRGHVAVVLGVAAAAAALGGSLVVGDSVRGSLATTALGRLGRTTHVVESTRFFREALAGDLAGQPSFAAAFDAACPLVALSGAATHGTTRRRAGDVLVYGVDERFWALQRVPAPEGLAEREALVSEALASELGAGVGEPILLRLHAAPGIPGSSLFGRRDDPARAVRLTVRGVLRTSLGELTWRPRSGAVRAAFVPLRTLQRALGLDGRANVVLAAAKVGSAPAAELPKALRAAITLEDLGLRLRVLPAAGALQLETTSALVDDALADAATGVAQGQGLAVSEVLVYLANALRVGDRVVPYSLVAALDDAALRKVGEGGVTGRDDVPPIVLNDWTASSLRATPGARVALDYFVWHEEGRLTTESATFDLTAVTEMAGLAADRDLSPEYPGITESQHLADWDPPFPIDLDRIRPEDEAYWDRHRATPKAFVPLAVGQRLWGHAQGRLTSLRLAPPARATLEETRDRFAAGLLSALHEAGAAPGASWSAVAVIPAREAALAAARGSTDFGEYFAYFSFFLVVAGLLLAGLFFRLGLEQRLREVGLLEALGFSAGRLRRHFLTEGIVLAGLGGLVGAFAAAGYAAMVLWGLRTLWTGALGTRDLELHLRPWSPLLGALGAGLAAAFAVAWTLRDLRRLSPRSLLAGALEPWRGARARRRLLVPGLLAALALILVLATRAGVVGDTAGFFGAGGLLLASALVLAHQVAGRRPAEAAAVRSVTGLGLRGVSFRPGRSVVCIALVAAATFVIVAVGAFRQEGTGDLDARTGPSGGYRLLAWSVAPLHHDLGTRGGQDALALDPALLEGVSVARFPARRGDDASCLNLYGPREPTVLGASAAFLREGRFSFQGSLAETPEERANPWGLLERGRDEDGAIPVIADAGSLAYVLHRELGDVLSLGETGVRVRFVGALAPGLLQGELIMAERHFQTAFPERTGASFFLFGVPEARADALSQGLEDHLGDFGFDVSEAATRLRDFHRVENTYIATFQALGALGLLLGVVGLATVLARNALEQRGELALLRAVGYRTRHLTWMVLAENAVLVGLGFLAGAVPALVAIAPMVLDGRGAVPRLLVAGLLAALAATGALVSWMAVAFIRRLPLLASLRSE